MLHLARNPSKFFWQIMETMEALQRGKRWKEHGKSNERAMKELGPKPYGKGFSPQKLKERSLVDLLSDQILYFISEL